VTGAEAGGLFGEKEIRSVLGSVDNLRVDTHTVAVDEDLFDCGLSSHDCVSVMLDLEEIFDVEFPDALLRKSTFESLRSISVALQSCTGDTPSP
jgi:acyl carrier protein